MLTIEPKTIVLIVIALLVLAILIRAYHMDCDVERKVVEDTSWLSSGDPQATLKSNCPERGCVQFPNCPEPKDECK